MADTEALAGLLTERDRLRQLNELQAATIERQADSIQSLMEQSERRKEYADRLRTDVRELVDALQTAIWRLDDMLRGDDGQAWKEAERAMPPLRALLAKHKETT